MNRRIVITPEIRKEIEALKEQGFGAHRISKILGLNRRTVSCYITMINRGIERPGEYFSDNAKKAGFRNYAARKRFEKSMRGFATEKEYTEYRLMLTGDQTYTDYRRRLAAEQGMTLYDAQKARLKRRGFDSVHQYHKFRTWLKGMSLRECEQRNYKGRQRRLEYIVFAAYINSRLEQKEMRPTVLARKIGTSSQAVLNYCTTRNLPRPEIARKIFKEFGDSYITIEDLVRDF